MARRASGFIYCVSVLGVTGARDALSDELAAFIARVRARADLPLAIGFGICRAEHVARSASWPTRHRRQRAHQSHRRRAARAAGGGRGGIHQRTADSGRERRATTLTDEPTQACASTRTTLSPQSSGHEEDGLTSYCRGVRGATTVERDTAEDILEATRELLLELIAAQRDRAGRRRQRHLHHDARPARRVPGRRRPPARLDATSPLLCGHEMTRPGALGRCIRVLIHLNTTAAGPGDRARLPARGRQRCGPTGRR